MSELTNQSNLPAEVVEAFSAAAVTALREMTQLDALLAPQDTTSELKGELVEAVMQLLRPVSGTFALVMAVDTAERLTERYLPVGTELTKEIVNDVVGEFANVIAGQAKTMLKGTPYHFLLSLPVVSRGAIAAKRAGFAANFQTDSGQVHLFVALSPAE
ncbi:chemotaxis protein CheX [Anatilimnocola sp. NA78]|uniref:chemotaxis protein CheX n=1 Tax=Anatilimnocola sp. NA78 TaxID=3415683 RepID=UPI003CE5A57D